jgi:hypothetical protein
VRRVYFLLITILSNNFFIFSQKIRNPFVFSKNQKFYSEQSVHLVGVAKFQNRLGGILKIGKRSQVVFEGEGMSGYKVKSIHEKRVLLAKNEKVIELKNGS